MNRIGWLDPSMDSRNTGDQIIADAVSRVFAEIAPDTEIVRLPTQRWMSRDERATAAGLSCLIVGGTNLLNSNIPRYIQWRLDPLSIRALKGKVSTLGVGWWQYQSRPNRLSSMIWRALLRYGVNSMRDGYSQRQLASAGVDSVNTGCPTMWELPDRIEFGAEARTVITTITDYARDADRDRNMLDLLLESYDSVLIWPQGSKDSSYLRSLVDSSRLSLIGPKLDDYNEALTGDVDYLGTRLHGGVRALQHGRRAFVVAVDNRATEIGRETGLPVSPTISTDLLANWRSSNALELTLPRDRIAAWKTAIRDRF